MSEQNNCDQIEPQLPDWLSARLDPAVALAVAQHLDDCHRCRAAAAHWRRLEAALASHFAAGAAAPPVDLAARITGAIDATSGISSARLRALLLTAVAAVVTLALMVLAVAGAGPGISPHAAAVGLAAQYWATLALQGAFLANNLAGAAPAWTLTSLWTVAGLAVAAALSRAEMGRWTETLAPRGGL